MIYGFGISGTWKGFDLNVHFQGAGKSSFFIDGPTVYAFSSGEWGNVLKDVAESDRWISADISGNPATENPNAEYPRLSFGGNSNNYRASTFWLRDGSYLRLKTLEFGYTLPKQIVNKIMFNNIRIFFRGSNILTFSKFIIGYILSLILYTVTVWFSLSVWILTGPYPINFMRICPCCPIPFHCSRDISLIYMRYPQSTRESGRIPL